jgi:hypothetical protein
MKGEPEQLRSISIAVHEADPARIDRDALTDGVTAAFLAVGDPNLRIVVSGAFEDYVRRHDAALPGLSPYVQERVRGQAVGKIVRLKDGSQELLVDASVLDRDRSGDHDPVRLFMHEALHLVISRRDESTCGRRARLGHELGTSSGAFAGMAGRVGEEYRVERALREAEHPLEAPYREQLGAMANDYAETLRVPFWTYQDVPGSGTLQRLMEVAVKGFEDLTPIVAYLVGDDVGAGVRSPPQAAVGSPDSWFRHGYELLYEPLAALPSATTPCTIVRLDALLMGVERALEEWFWAVGFRWSGGPNEYRFDIPGVDLLASQLAE